MNIRGLLVALFLALVAAGGIWWSVRDEKSKEGKPETKADAPKLIDVKEADFTRVELKRSTDTLTLERQGTAWRITAPASFSTDADAVSALLSNLGSLNADKIVDDKPADLGQYGLASPSFEIAYTTRDKKSRRLKIGDTAPMSGGFYAQLDGDPKVYAIASYNQSNLNKSAADLRDKRLLTTNFDQISRLEITTSKGSYEVGKNNSGEWQIVKPRPLRAESFQLEEILRKVKDAKMDLARSEDDAKKAAAGFAAGQLLGVLKLTDANGTQTLEVRQQKLPNEEVAFWAKSSLSDAVHKTTSEIGQGVERHLDAVRNRKIFDFGFSEVSKLEYKSLVFEKKGQDWFSGTKKMDNVGIQGLLDRLRDLEAKSFADPLPAGTPSTELTVTSHSGKRVERVRFLIAAGQTFAERIGDPTGYQIEAKVPGEIDSFALAIKEAKPEPAPAKKK